MAELFLTEDELKVLTGRSFRKLQIEALRKMGVPFFVNAVGRAVVARVAIEGRSAPAPTAPKKAWIPPGLRPKEDQ